MVNGDCYPCPNACKICDADECYQCVEHSSVRSELCRCDIGFFYSTESRECVPCVQGCAKCDSVHDCI